MDPRFITFLCIIFAALGSYNLYTGSRRMRDARRAGKPIRWYKQLSFLTGVEYILLTFYFLLLVADRQGNIAPGVRGLVVPLSLVLLIAAAIIAGFVIRRAILNVRTARASNARTPAAVRVPVSSSEPEPALSKHEQEELAQRQRERRKKAAAARRRRAGRA